MAEPTCVMQAFSSSGSVNEAQEDNPMYGLDESVSLGRFMSESLSWEKWSTFSRNRYVEEAEMYSRPGSVKQKKAYFEAHFKRMAALKAAALLEQSNSAQVGAAESDLPKSEYQPNENGAKIDDPSSPLSTLDQQWIEKEDMSSGSVASYNEEKSNGGDDQLGSEVVEEPDQADYVEDEFIEHFMDVEEQYPSTEMNFDLEKTQDEIKEQFMDVEEQYPSTDIKCDQDEIKEQFMDSVEQYPSTDMKCNLGRNQDEIKEQFMDFEEQYPSTAIKCDQDEIKEQFMYSVEQYPSTDMKCDLERKQDEIKEQFMDFEEQYPSTEMECGIDSCVELDVFHECVVETKDYDSDFVAYHKEDDKDSGKDNCPLGKIIEQDGPTEKHFMDFDNQNISTEMESGLVKKDDSMLQCSTFSEHSIAATSIRSEPNPSPSAITLSTPKGKMKSSYLPSVDAETTTALEFSSSPRKAMSQPEAVHPGKENTYTPIGRKSWIDDPDKKRTPLRMSINRELNRLISPVIKKMGSSSKASKKDCTTPSKTPAKASVDGLKNTPPETPQSGKRRARALFDSSGFGGTKATGSRWQFLSSEGPKSPAGGKNKTSSPIIPKSFCLNGSRAPRRKENLEEKFNAKATESIQQQSKLKEKPKEVTKMRQSFCFGAKLSSESFREREKSKEKNVNSKVGRSRLQNMTSLPPRKPARCQRELTMSIQK